MNLGILNIKKAYLGIKELTRNNAFVGIKHLLEDTDDRLRFVSTGVSSIGLSRLSTGQTIEYSFDDETWLNMTTATTINLNDGDVVYMRGILAGDNDHYTHNYTQFKMTGKIESYGNINYLWDYQDLDAVLKVGCGIYLFRDCAVLHRAPKLPSISLNAWCYQGMFLRCSNLLYPPELPATILYTYCYNDMFSNCTSLTTTPDLSNANLAVDCYSGMFNNCTSLVTPPKLPKTQLQAYCYSAMFKGCTSLICTPELPATRAPYYCYVNMFAGCTSLETATVIMPISSGDYGNCAINMFNGCTNLKYIRCLATYYFNPTNWVNNVSPTGTFVKNPDMNDWPIGVNGIPEGWTVEDAE